VRHWRIAAAADRTAPEPFYLLSRVAARTVATPQPTPSSQTVRRCTGRVCGRRPVRGVRSEEGKSGPEARASAVAGDSPPAYGPARDRNDSSLPFESSKATASSSAHPPKDPIFHAVEPGADPRPPGRPPLRMCRKRARDGTLTAARRSCEVRPKSSSRGKELVSA
jgi:hypothetical protein